MKNQESPHVQFDLRPNGSAASLIYSLLVVLMIQHYNVLKSIFRMNLIDFLHGFFRHADATEGFSANSDHYRLPVNAARMNTHATPSVRADIKDVDTIAPIGCCHAGWC